METKHILKIPFETSGNNNGNSPPDLLLCIISPPKPSNTTLLPDLTLQATEGSSAFTGQLYSSRLSKILTQDAGLSVAEFEAVLLHILLQQPLSAAHTSLQDISLTAVWSREEGSRRSPGIRLRFKREIGDIRHYVGETLLKTDGEVELDVLEWTRVAIARGVTVEREVDGLRTRLAQAEKDVLLVRAQLEELLQIKARDEEILMGKFVEVLNEKKARIRELGGEAGRGGRPWPEVEEEIKEEDEQSVVNGKRGRPSKGKKVVAAKAQAVSRGRKRKQVETPIEPELASGSEQNENPEDQQAEGDMETDREMETLTMEDGDVDMSVESDDLDAPSRSQRPGGKAKGKASQSGSKARGTMAKAGPVEQISDKQHALRPRKSSRAASEDDASTDDEL